MLLEINPDYCTRYFSLAIIELERIDQEGSIVADRRWQQRKRKHRGPSLVDLAVVRENGSLHQRPNVFLWKECIQEEELLNLLTKKPQPICYDGFEPSGRMHIAQGVMKTVNVNNLTSAGCKVKIWIAYWFAQLNNKMGGDLNKIQTVGNNLIEIWKAAGMNLENAEVIWSLKKLIQGHMNTGQ